MYESHFGLNECPFRLTPDTSFFLGCTHYQEALNTLLVAVNGGEGFVKITGEVGSGKTMLCQKFIATLDKSFIVVNISHPSLDSYHLLEAIAEGLDIPIEADMGQTQLLRLLTKTLFYDSSLHGHIVVCLDEAQAISMECLETLRLLTNLQTKKCRILQVVLFGQPELDENLAAKSMRQLRQRITFQYNLEGLLEDEVERYLDHRLKTAGFKGERLFSKAAAQQLYRRSGGIPRLVNILAHKSLLLVYGEGTSEVLPRHVNQAAADTQEAKHGRFDKWANKLSSIFRFPHKKPVATSLTNQMLQGLEDRNGAVEDLGPAGDHIQAVPTKKPILKYQRYVPVLLLLFVFGGYWFLYSEPYRVSVSDQVNLDAPIESVIAHTDSTESTSEDVLTNLDLSEELTTLPNDSSDSNGSSIEKQLETRLADAEKLLSSLTDVQELLSLSEGKLSNVPFPKMKPGLMPTIRDTTVVQSSKQATVVGRDVVPAEQANFESFVDVEATVEEEPMIIASVPDDIAEPITPVPSHQHVETIRPMTSLVLDEQVTKQINTQQQAEYEYKKAVTFLQQGRLNEAMEKLELTLSLNVGHEVARQSMVGLLLERNRLSEAESLLREGLKLNSGQSQFAQTLSRIQVERGNIEDALKTLQLTLPQSMDQPEYRAFFGTLLQSQSRHNEAIEHYLAAVDLSPDKGIWLMGLGISLQEEGHLSEAHEAFSRAQSSHDLNGDLRAFVNQRIRQIRREIH